jgi:hypothetical protein
MIGYPLAMGNWSSFIHPRAMNFGVRYLKKHMPSKSLKLLRARCLRVMLYFIEHILIKLKIDRPDWVRKMDLNIRQVAVKRILDDTSLYEEIKGNLEQ